MYYIDSSVDKPDTTFLFDKITNAVNVRGIRLSDDIFTLRNKLTEEKEREIENIRERYGIQNPNSTAQLVAWMEANLRPELLAICTEKDKVSTKQELLVYLANADDTVTFPVDILCYRKVQKKLQSVMELLSSCDRFGIVKPTVSLGKTNRVNYAKPAIMNIPKSILWKVIRPFKDGSRLVSVDIKNQEPWILINQLDIKELKDIIRKNPSGLYDGIYKIVYGEEPDKLQRKECKTAWNALTYGATKHGLKRICRNIDGEKLYNYFTHIREIQQYQGRAFALATTKARKVETYFGTYIFPDAWEKNQLKRQLMDFPVQGTGSDILALLVQHFYDVVESNGLDDYFSIYYTRHDEIIFEVSKECIEEYGEDAVLKFLRDVMEHKVDDWEPFKLEIGFIDAEEDKVIDLEDEEDA